MRGFVITSYSIHYTKLYEGLRPRGWPFRASTAAVERSPRRRELLTQIGVQFDTLFFREPPRQDDDVDESAHEGEIPEVYVERVARAKAEHGWRTVLMRRLMPQPVLAADTTLEVDGEIVGKPLDAADAERILRRLSGRSHRVLTAVSVAFEGRVETVTSSYNFV